MMDRKALHGIKILDFTRLFAGPFCTMLLGDLGADVVKVEPPDGDPTRSQGPPFHDGQGMSFLAGNRNKRSIVLNTKDPADRERARALALAADVIVENFRPGVMERMGLGYESLAKDNPRLIYVAMSGMGASGPFSGKGALDLTIQAEAGYMSLTGERDGKPIKLGTSAFDLVCGQYAVSGVLTALYQRSETGRGQRVETSLLEGILTYLVDAGMEWLVAGSLRPKWGSEHASNVPYKAFLASDGWLVIAGATQRLWLTFVEVLGRPDLAEDSRFATMADRVNSRDVLYEILDAEVSKWTVQALAARLDEAGVPCAPVNTLDRVFAHPQVLARGMKATARTRAGDELPVIGPAVKYGSFNVASDWRAPPPLGADTAEVLHEWLGSQPAGRGAQ
jgi:succinate--hydroxymethylglutarate CoA-transferase